MASNSSKALDNALTESHDRNLIEFKSGHVGLMIGKNVHKELWPKVGEMDKQPRINKFSINPLPSF